MATSLDIEVEDVGMTVVDADAHYTGAFEDLVEYMEEGPWKTRFERADNPGTVKGFWPGLTSADDAGYRTGSSEYFDVDTDSASGIPEIMDALGIDKILLLGNQMLSFGKMKGDDRRPTVYANAYVDYLLDRVLDPDRGIYGTIPVPYQDPAEAVDLIERASGEPGIVAACFVAGITEPPLGNRHYDPIYDAADRNDLPVIVHGGTPGVDKFHLSGFTHRLETHTLGFMWAITAHLTSIVARGVPEKFPDLDLVFQESGLFYLPMMMYRMDAEYFRKPNEAPLLEHRPSEYMKEFYYGTQPLEYPPRPHYFEYVIEMLGGPGRLIYSSDYPHTDYDPPTAITDMSFLSEDEKAAILGGNAEAVFGI